MKQLAMPFLNNYRKQFGGSLLLGKRKSLRPLSSKHPIHLVLKSEMKGVFNPGNRKLEELIRATALKFQIRIYDMALNWSHIHCVIRIKDRAAYNAFIRALTSILAMKIRKHKGQKGKNLLVENHKEKVFTLRPFTRVLSWGRDFKQALSYQILNQLEALGLQVRFRKNRKKPNHRPKDDVWRNQPNQAIEESNSA